MQNSTQVSTEIEKNAAQALREIDTELRSFEADERRRLGLDTGASHWEDPRRRPFLKEQRGQTTVLLGGLTSLHDDLFAAVLEGLGYKSKSLNTPDNEAMQIGKEYGNRAQCNPTYFTVGNLLKYLIHLRDVQGMKAKDIVDHHVFITFGACGPCRFGTYLTEYRKALRDAGFEGFRLYDFSNYGHHKGTPEVAGIELDLQLYKAFFKAVFAGDAVNTLGYRTRPYEVVPGSTDQALDRCHDILCSALSEKRSVLLALRRCRKVFEKVEVDRFQAKPKVAIIGEFWAMTTEGDGNYEMQRFLETEGAECEIQIPTGWALYLIWEARYDIRERMMLRQPDGLKHGSEPASPLRKLAAHWLADRAVRLGFSLFARQAGLKHYHLPDMDHIARTAHEFYSNQLRGGEGHMEVGKVIDFVAERRAHMVISVKPFGCMPSSSVSDGIQSLVGAKYPDVIFTPIETSGDGAVSAHSRIQMALFKARQKAQEEYDAALAATSLDSEEIASRVHARPKFSNALYYPRHRMAGTGTNSVYELGRRPIL